MAHGSIHHFNYQSNARHPSRQNGVPPVSLSAIDSIHLARSRLDNAIVPGYLQLGQSIKSIANSELVDWALPSIQHYRNIRLQEDEVTQQLSEYKAELKSIMAKAETLNNDTLATKNKATKMT